MDFWLVKKFKFLKRLLFYKKLSNIQNLKACNCTTQPLVDEAHVVLYEPINTDTGSPRKVRFFGGKTKPH